jgi:hypothetical protein
MLLLNEFMCVFLILAGFKYFIMKSFIKILGPPLLESIKELEKIAVDMPQVCIMDTIITRQIPSHLAKDVGGHRGYESWVGGYYRTQGVVISQERCRTIISASGEQLGEFDFFFEWLENPTSEQLNDLIEKIDNALSPLGSYYSIITK